MNHATSSATNEHGANVAALRISDSYQRFVQSSFELSPVRGSTEGGDVASSSSIHARDDTFHGVERLAVTSAHELLAKEQRLLNCHGVQSSAVLLAFRHIAGAGNLRNGSSSLGNSPRVAENLRVVDVTLSDDCHRRRTNRTFLERVANSAPHVAAVNSSGGNSTDSASDGEHGGGSQSRNQHDFRRALVHQQIAGNDVVVGSNSDAGITCQRSCRRSDEREDHRLREVAMLDVAGRLILEQAGKAEQRSSTVGHQAGDSLSKRQCIQVLRRGGRREKTDCHDSCSLLGKVRGEVSFFGSSCLLGCLAFRCREHICHLHEVLLCLLLHRFR